MANSAGFTEKWNAFMNKLRPGMEATGRVFGKIGNVFGQIGLWIYRLRKVFMAIPVLYASIKLALFNMENLPEQVGLNLLSTGEFSMLVERNIAVLGPISITAACLLLMFCSRRGLYPWLISIFSLALPLLILATNHFDGLLVLFGMH